MLSVLYTVKFLTGIDNKQEFVSLNRIKIAFSDKHPSLLVDKVLEGGQQLTTTYSIVVKIEHDKIISQFLQQLLVAAKDQNLDEIFKI